MKPPDKPQFDIKQLLQAAQLTQIDPSTLPRDQTPWSWKDSRAFAWQSAFRSFNPAMAEAAEVAYGPAISLALPGALDGHTELTPDLATEFSIKRLAPGAGQTAMLGYRWPATLGRLNIPYG